MWQPQSIYSQFLLRTPTLLFGKGAVRGLFNYPAGRIAVIHGTSFTDQEAFSSTFKKKDLCFVKRTWGGEPNLEGLSETLRELEQFRPDTIIACGGGSVIDGAKLCRVFYEFPFLDLKTANMTGLSFKTRFVAVPTTFGSGAEVSSAAVYVNKASHRKELFVAHELQPDVVVYDPSYLRGMSTTLLCTSAMDAFAHMIEGYVSNVRNDMAEFLAEAGLSALCGELDKLLRGHADEIDWSRLQYAGYCGGIVQNHCIVGAAHAIAHQLTDHGYSHAEAVALLLPTVIRANAENADAAEKYRTLAARIGFASTDDLADYLDRVVEAESLGQRKELLKALLQERIRDTAFLSNVSNDKGGKGNPVALSEDYLVRLIGRL